MKIKRLQLLLILFFAFGYVWSGQYRRPVKPTKNLILMIPDGTSMGVVSAARWYQIYNKTGHDQLATDPYICGSVKNHSSDGPIPCSAPAMSSYMTGVFQRAGNLSIYPKVDPEKDLIALDSTMTYQPLTTILEAAKYQQKKAIGLVVTVEFPHATPAACASHYYDRHSYQIIAPQMAYQNLDVMFGGGNAFVTQDMKEHFEKTGTLLLQHDLQAFRKFRGKEKVWALFCDNEHPYDLDRDTTQIPSLTEMTLKAIGRLSQNENGFFLMIEGSKVDWAAHANDPIGTITEYLAFDKAVSAAVEFAKENGETTVVILPDHGNSGFSIGRKDFQNYDKAGLDTSFANVSKFKSTAENLEQILLKSDTSAYVNIFKEYMDIDLSNEELSTLISVRDYHEHNYMKVGESTNMLSTIVGIINSRTYFGFTTGGHTGEDVFLAVYHPDQHIPVGMNTGQEINQYLFDVLGLEKSLQDIGDEIFVKHSELFSGMNYFIDRKGEHPTLIINKGRNKMQIPAFKSTIILNNKTVDLESIVVYIDKNDTFYVPRNLKKMIE